MIRPMSQQGSFLPSFNLARQLLVLALTLLTSACQPKNEDSDHGSSKQQAARPILFVSVPPQAFLLKTIAGSEFEVRTLIGQGQDPHHWLPSPKQILTLGKAKAWWPAGLVFEQNLVPKIHANHSSLNIYPSTTSRPTDTNHKHSHQHGHQQSDPHTWLSPLLLIKECQGIAKNLSQLAPDKTELFQSRALDLEIKISTLHQVLKQQLLPYHGRSFLIYHNALEHFANTYQLTQKVIQSGDASPDPKQLLQIIKQAQQDQNTVIFIQPQFDQQSVHMIAEAIGGQVISLDPLSEDVLANLKHIADTLTQSFSLSDS